MKLELEVGGGKVELPINGGVRIQLSRDPDNPEKGFSVSTTNYDLQKDTAKLAAQWVEDGKDGNPGIWEGLPF